MDYSILINCLEEWVVFRGSALEWFLFCLTYRLFPILVGKTFSCVAFLSCGIPQGSALGHLLFSIYMLPFWPCYLDHNIPLSSHDSDNQMFCPVSQTLSAGCHKTFSLLVSQILKSSACNLGTIFDWNISFVHQITKLLNSASFSSGLSQKLRHFNLMRTTKTIIHAFIT